MENYWLSISGNPVLVEDLDAIIGFDRVHPLDSFAEADLAVGAGTPQPCLAKLGPD
jgi:hypothetical protein